MITVGSRPSSNSDTPGLRLKKVRESLNLRFRDVEEASNIIAARRGNDEYIIQLSRLSDIENRGTVPSIYRLYSLCTIYGLDTAEVLSWYGVDLSQQPGDAASMDIKKTRALQFSTPSVGEIEVPLRLDPGLDPSKTTFLNRMIQSWGRLPLALLSQLDLLKLRYGLVGSEDMTMYPLIQPGALVLIDPALNKIQNTGWTNEFERPIYFLQHRITNDCHCGWATMADKQVVLQPHPAAPSTPKVFRFPDEIEVLGQVVGVATRLDPSTRRRARGV